SSLSSSSSSPYPPRASLPTSTLYSNTSSSTSLSFVPSVSLSKPSGIVDLLLNSTEAMKPGCLKIRLPLPHRRLPQRSSTSLGSNSSTSLQSNSSSGLQNSSSSSSSSNLDVYNTSGSSSSSSSNLDVYNTSGSSSSSS